MFNWNSVFPLFNIPKTFTCKGIYLDSRYELAELVGDI